MESNQAPLDQVNENKAASGSTESGQIQPTDSERRFDRGTATDPFAASSEKEFSHAKHEGNDLANNDGSVLETLDTAFHEKPGYSEGESVSGSNRADYYEQRSYGKADDEEELNARNNEEGK